MSQGYNRKKQKSRMRWEFLAVIGLFVVIAVGAFFVLIAMMPSNQYLLASGLDASSPEAKAQTAARSYQVRKMNVMADSAQESGYSGGTAADFPDGYEVQGTVDGQYTVAVNPETGEMLVHDAFSASGSNTTSVEGLRKAMVEDALEEEQNYQQSGDPGSAQSQWHKNVSRAAMEAALAGGNSSAKLKKLFDLGSNPPPGVAPKSFGGFSQQAALERQKEMAGSGGPTLGDAYCSVLNMCNTPTAGSTTTTATAMPAGGTSTYTEPTGTSTYPNQTYTSPTTSTVSPSQTYTQPTTTYTSPSTYTNSPTYIAPTTTTTTTTGY